MLDGLRRAEKRACACIVFAIAGVFTVAHAALCLRSWPRWFLLPKGAALPLLAR